MNTPHDKFITEPMTEELVYQLESETRRQLGEDSFTTVEWFAEDSHVTFTTTRGSHARAVVLRLGTKIESVTRLYVEGEPVEWSFKIPKTITVIRKGKERTKAIFRGFQAIVPKLSGAELVITKKAIDGDSKVPASTILDELDWSKGRNAEAAFSWFASESYFELVTARGTFVKNLILRIGDLVELVKVTRDADGEPMEWTVRIPNTAVLATGRTCKLFRSPRMFFPDVGGIDKSRFVPTEGDDDGDEDDDDDAE